MQIVAQQVAATLDARPSRELIARVELALLTAVAAAYGYAMGKHALVGALGREASRELDAEVLRTLGEMLHAHLRAGAGTPSDLPEERPG
jgi:hypothetical protein